MTEHYPCRVCTLEVEDDDKSVQCDLCDRWIHIKCAKINHQKYEKLLKDPLASYCLDWKTEISFPTLSNKDSKDFLCLETIPQPSRKSYKNRAKKLTNMMSHFKQVNQLFDQSENSISCDYYDIDGFSKIVIKVILLSYT